MDVQVRVPQFCFHFFVWAFRQKHNLYALSKAVLLMNALMCLRKKAKDKSEGSKDNFHQLCFLCLLLLNAEINTVLHWRMPEVMCSRA